MRDMPACFDSRAQYEGWRKFALIAKEVVSICSDCTPEYRARMHEAGRCHPVRAAAMFTVNPPRNPPRKPAITVALTAGELAAREIELKLVPELLPAGSQVPAPV